MQGPSGDPACFRPWGKNTTYYQWKKKPGPFRIALANGFIGNTWRIQMIKTAKAFADQPAVKSKLKEFKVISTGELPSPVNIPTGCSFNSRCPFAMDVCRRVDPTMVEAAAGHSVRCHLYPQSQVA